MKPLLLLCIPFVASAVPALGAGTVAVTPSDLSEVKTLDEVVVTGNLQSLYEARKAVLAAEDRFYARFNQLNKDDRFDVSCSTEAPTGTRFKARLCVPRIVDDATHDAAATLTLRNGGGGSFNFVSLSAIRTMYAAELKKRTLQLVRSDPELMRALLEHARLQQHYEELRKEKFKGHSFVWD